MSTPANLSPATLDGLDPDRWGLPHEAVASLGRRLLGCWERFHDCFTTRTRDTSHLAHVYLQGLLLLHDERNYANIARRIIGPDDDGQSLQQFMSDSPWTAHAVFARIQQDIGSDSQLHGGILSLDESGDKRAGELSAGAGRQYLGRLGKVDVGQVGVAPAFRRRGLASALVTEALARLRARGYDTVFLHVNTNNPGALATWRSLGFQPAGRRGRFERIAVPR